MRNPASPCSRILQRRYIVVGCFCLLIFLPLFLPSISDFTFYFERAQFTKSDLFGLCTDQLTFCIPGLQNFTAFPIREYIQCGTYDRVVRRKSNFAIDRSRMHFACYNFENYVYKLFISKNLAKYVQPETFQIEIGSYPHLQKGFGF